MNRLAFPLLAGLIALSGCADQAPLTGQAQADAATRAACRERAEAVYDQQNRGEIYGQGSQVNSPFSASYQPEKPDRGLSQLFVHDKMVSDCVRNTGTGAVRPDSPPPVKR